VKDPDLVFQHRDAQPAEHALHNDETERGKTQVAQPAPRIDPPDPDGQDDREKANRGSDEPVGVLEENSPNPLRNRKEKHVVAKSGGPIRDSETDALARDHAAAANQEKGGERGEPGETMEHAGALPWRCFGHDGQLDLKAIRAQGGLLDRALRRAVAKIAASRLD
jgi:hypothetical protein